MREEDRRRGHLIAGIVIVAVALVAGGLIWYYCCPADEEDECPEFEFGDDDLNVEIKPNATLDVVEVEPDVQSEPEPEPGYWANYDEEEVDGFHIEMPYRVNITDGINESTVLLEVKVWVEVCVPWYVLTMDEDDDRELIVDENETVTTFNEWDEWVSEKIELPDHDGYGWIKFKFDIWVKVTGDIENTTLTLKHEIEENKFDRVMIFWHEPWTPIICTLSAIGAGILGLGVVLKFRKAKQCPCVGQPDCYCDM